MKAIFLVVGLFAGFAASAQSSPCYIDAQYTEPGLYPLPDSLPCFVGNCVCNDVTIQFINFDSATVAGQRVRVDYIIIDSILNLPCGINWATSNDYSATRNRFENQEKGCIRLFGATNDAAGQYKLKIKVKAKVSLLPSEVPYEAEALGFRVDVRLINNRTDSCPAIDTTANAVLKTASCIPRNFFPYTFDAPPILCAYPCVGVNEISSINYFSFYPNPTANASTVSFTADKAASYTARIVNLYGQEVSREVIEVQAGANAHPIDVSALASGIYLFTISDGANITSYRFVVE